MLLWVAFIWKCKRDATIQNLLPLKSWHCRVHGITPAVLSIRESTQDLLMQIIKNISLLGVFHMCCYTICVQKCVASTVITPKHRHRRTVYKKLDSQLASHGWSQGSAILRWNCYWQLLFGFHRKRCSQCMFYARISVWTNESCSTDAIYSLRWPLSIVICREFTFTVHNFFFYPDWLCFHFIVNASDNMMQRTLWVALRETPYERKFIIALFPMNCAWSVSHRLRAIRHTQWYFLHGERK